MKKVLIILVVILTILGGIRYIRYRENRIYENERQVFIDKMERYRSIHKRLPNNLESLGEKETMSTGLYYERVDSNTYKLYSCIGFDDYTQGDLREKYDLKLELTSLTSDIYFIENLSLVEKNNVFGKDSKRELSK